MLKKTVCFNGKSISKHPNTTYCLTEDGIHLVYDKVFMISQ